MTDEQAKDPRGVRGSTGSAPQPQAPDGPAEDSLPAEDTERPAEDSAAPQAAPDSASQTAPDSAAALDSDQSAEDDVQVQSKFDRPASTLGIRPSVEQSKAVRPPTGLGARPPIAPSMTPPAAPREPGVPGVPVAAAPSGVVPAASPAAPSLPPAPSIPPAPAIPPVPAPPTARAFPSAAVRPMAPAPVLEEEEPPEHVPTWAERFRRLSPALVILGIGSLGALGFLVYAMTSHTTPVAVLLSAGVVVTLAFATDAFIASIATWRAAVWDEDPGRALLLAVVAGGSAIVAAGAFGAVTVLVLVLTGI